MVILRNILSLFSPALAQNTSRRSECRVGPGWAPPAPGSPLRESKLGSLLGQKLKRLLLGAEIFILGGGPYGTLLHFWDNALCRYAFGNFRASGMW